MHFVVVTLSHGCSPRSRKELVRVYARSGASPRLVGGGVRETTTIVNRNNRAARGSIATRTATGYGSKENRTVSSEGTWQFSWHSTETLLLRTRFSSVPPGHTRRSRGSSRESPRSTRTEYPEEVSAAPEQLIDARSRNEHDEYAGQGARRVALATIYAATVTCIRGEDRCKDRRGSPPADRIARIEGTENHAPTNEPGAPVAGRSVRIYPRRRRKHSARKLSTGSAGMTERAEFGGTRK